MSAAAAWKRWVLLLLALLGLWAAYQQGDLGQWLTLERLKASVRAKAEHPFRVIKLQFGFAKVRFKGLAKNTARLQMLFAMSNLWMSRKPTLQRTQVPSIG